MLAVLLFAILPGVLKATSGDPAGMFSAAWTSMNLGLLLAIVVAVTVCRAVLALIAWSPWFERLYPRVSFPLVSVCHGFWAFACGVEILGAHPEYIAPLVADAFAAFFFSGLLFRQAAVVTLVAASGFIVGGLYHSGSFAPMMAFGAHLFINMGLAAIAGYAHERSVRSQFLEHGVLSEMAARDGLTGLKNRRAFDEHLAMVWQQALRDRRSIGILMIDVDEFKHFNDCYGHQSGDRALQRIAEEVDAVSRRPLDLAARYGGEELAVILYDLPREHVIDIAQRLQERIQALGIEHRGSAAGVVTVSIGVAIVHPNLHRSPGGALQLADEALYGAKHAGRNRIHVLSSEFDARATDVLRAVRF
nr:MAG: hypothetical protein DIU56_05790 [Pseudomonadota bacterium]